MSSLKSFVRNNSDMVEKEDGNIYFICPVCKKETVVKSLVDVYQSTLSRKFHFAWCLAAE